VVADVYAAANERTSSIRLLAAGRSIVDLRNFDAGT